MGAQTSVVDAKTKVINSAITDVLIKTGKSCATSAFQSQSRIVEGDANYSGVDSSFNQESSIDLTCVQDSKNMMDLKNDMQAEIENKLKSENTGQNLGFQTGISASTTTLITELVNRISSQDIQECSNQISQIQSDVVKGDLNAVNSNLSFNQQSSIITNCIQNNSNISKAVNKVATQIATETETFNVGVITAGSSIIIIIIIVIGLIIYYRNKKGQQVNPFKMRAPGVQPGYTSSSPGLYNRPLPPISKGGLPVQRVVTQVNDVLSRS